MVFLSVPRGYSLVISQFVFYLLSSIKKCTILSFAIRNMSWRFFFYCFDLFYFHIRISHLYGRGKFLMEFDQIKPNDWKSVILTK